MMSRAFSAAALLFPRGIVDDHPARFMFELDAVQTPLAWIVEAEALYQSGSAAGARDAARLSAHREAFDLYRRAQQALALAALESERLGHHFIGTEHVLLGLLDAADAQVDVADAKALGGRRIGRGGAVDLPPSARNSALSGRRSEARCAEGGIVWDG